MSLPADCDPCDAAELLSQPISTTIITSTTTTSSSPDLQTLPLASLHPLPDPTCGFRPDEAPFQDALVPEQPLNLDQAFMTDISMTLSGVVQSSTGSHMATDLMERWVSTPCSNIVDKTNSPSGSLELKKKTAERSSFNSSVQIFLTCLNQNCPQWLQVI